MKKNFKNIIILVICALSLITLTTIIINNNSKNYEGNKSSIESQQEDNGLIPFNKDDLELNFKVSKPDKYGQYAVEVNLENNTNVDFISWGAMFILKDQNELCGVQQSVSLKAGQKSPKEEYFLDTEEIKPFNVDNIIAKTIRVDYLVNGERKSADIDVETGYVEVFDVYN